MKHQPLPKKRKTHVQKVQDTLSETISFVIKGKLTPIIKPSYLTTKTGKILERKVNKVAVSNNNLKRKIADLIPKPGLKKKNSCDINVKVLPKNARKYKKPAKSVKKANKISDLLPLSCDQMKKDVEKSCTEEKPSKKVGDISDTSPVTAKKDPEPIEVVSKIQKRTTKTATNKSQKNPSIKPDTIKPKKIIKKPSPKSKLEAVGNTKPKNKKKALPTLKTLKQQQEEDDLKTQLTIKKLLKQANQTLMKTPKYPKKTKKAKAEKAAVTKDTVTSESPELAIADNSNPEDMSQSLEKVDTKNTKATQDKKPISIKSKKTDQKSENTSTKANMKKEPIKITKNTSPKTKNAAKKKIKSNPNVMLMKKRVFSHAKNKKNNKADQRSRKLKLFSFWNGPKRHRVASLNALAKVHCLYENETRGNIIDNLETSKGQRKDSDEEVDEPVPPTRTLRSVPGLRVFGKHWEMHESSTSSDDSTIEEFEQPKASLKKKKTLPKSPSKPVEKKRRRNRTEIIMDLKDMVVRKRMASLNATAILAASYSMEKRAARSPKSEAESFEDDISSDEVSSSSSYKKSSAKVEEVKKEEKVIQVCATPDKKVAVILNQDTDVTITGVYVNSTTRSTHHEGYCSIAGMQYRISATSHTQTAATAVATETLLQSNSSNTQENVSGETQIPSCGTKSYAPLDALSSMQPPPGPGIHQSPHPVMGPPHPLSPQARRHCSSAFTAPPPAHHHAGDGPYAHGYYQPAGPLINLPHGHVQPGGLPKSAPLSEPSPTPTSPILQPTAPGSTGDSSDSEVIITSVSSPPGKDPLNSIHQPSPQPYHYPSSGTQYGSSYPPYYPPYYQPPTAPLYHPELCYGPSYPGHKYPATYRQRYPTQPPQYYPPPGDLYARAQSQQMVTATPSSNNNQYPGQPPTTALVEGYTGPPLVDYGPPPPHYYPGYHPPPTCYPHSQPRPIPYINATYQSCPCPMQSCPKNVLTGPLTGDSKRSNISIAKDSIPLPPVALALPLEPASAMGPPSPARGSAGMPPPPSPAGATYQPPPVPKQEKLSPESECKQMEKKRKARVGKAMVRNNIASFQQQNTMLLMCNPPQSNLASDVKREIESPGEKGGIQKKEVCSSDEESKGTNEMAETDACKAVESRLQESQVLLKTEKEPLEEKVSSEADEEQKTEDVEPIVKTVAENVKVKNMKRKLSVTKVKEGFQETTSTTTTFPLVKKQKVEKYPNGSYKDLIKKETNIFHINNGKRKLNISGSAKRGNSKKQTAKRKLSMVKEEIASKKLKCAHASTKLCAKETNVAEEAETEEQAKKGSKKALNSKAVTGNNNKKIAPAILDSLFARNNIDRTIEKVISESVPRTPKDTSALKVNDKCNNKNSKEQCAKKSTNSKNGQCKSKAEAQKSKVNTMKRRKSKCNEVVPQIVPRIPRKSLQTPRWSNGWTWQGNSYESTVFLNSDETTVVRKCYPAMRHIEGDVIEIRDCVLLKAGPRKNDLPFVAKIAFLWENPDDGEMMMSLLWYYRPEHTEQGRQQIDQPDEVFASRHKDSNSVACIDDKCFVLTFNEYCRYRKNLRRLEENIQISSPCIPMSEPYSRGHRQPPLQTAQDLVFFCRRVYDFRQKRMVKNPS